MGDIFKKILFFLTDCATFDDLRNWFFADLSVTPHVDAIGRAQSKQEKKVIDFINSENITNNLKDTYRLQNTYGGFTWGRNNPVYLRSRLDYIFAGKELINHLLASSVTFSLQESDHGFLFSEFSIDNIEYGPGIIRANAGLLDDPDTKDKVLRILRTDLDDSRARGWNPHLILDHHKYTLRQALIKEGKLKRNRDRSTYEHSCQEIDTLKIVLDKELVKISLGESYDQSKVDRLRQAIEIAEVPLNELKLEETKKLIFRSRAKWSEEGEKSNKYFLNLLKHRQKQMQIRKIISNGSTFYKQDEISKAINSFYRNLYKKQENLKPIDNDDELFKDLPTLNETEKSELEKPLNINEIHKTLLSCKDSAPGPDGISYDVYKQTWEVSGQVIMDAWNHSLRVGQTSQTQREAVITLLEKKGKDKCDLANLRPISLSNCDIKICTKTIALRTNKVLGKLLSETQTGYVPGRQVTNNNRMVEELIELVYNSDENAFLITLDAQKAFDSVDHDYLIKVLKAYKFPQTYIDWVKIIYKNLEASVLVNGFTTDKFRIDQSVKQGDALSCALFVLAIEPLLIRIQNNSKIEPIKLKRTVGNVDTCVEIKKAGFADDITCFTTNESSLQEIISEYEKFSSKSGIKLNVNKTEILVIGKNSGKNKVFKLQHCNNEYHIVEQEKVKICGITFSNNKEVAYKDNVV